MGAPCQQPSLRGERWSCIDGLRHVGNHDTDMAIAAAYPVLRCRWRTVGRASACIVGHPVRLRGSLPSGGIASAQRGHYPGSAEGAAPGRRRTVVATSGAPPRGRLPVVTRSFLTVMPQFRHTVAMPSTPRFPLKTVPGGQGPLL